jgi:hypothetical protein
LTLNRRLKIETNKTYDGWDWTQDGRFDEPRVKGADKRRRSKYQRTIEKRITRKEAEQFDE